MRLSDLIDEVVGSGDLRPQEPPRYIRRAPSRLSAAVADMVGPAPRVDLSRGSNTPDLSGIPRYHRTEPSPIPSTPFLDQAVPAVLDAFRTGAQILHPIGTDTLTPTQNTVAQVMAPTGLPHIASGIGHLRNTMSFPADSIDPRAQSEAGAAFGDLLQGGLGVAGMFGLRGPREPFPMAPPVGEWENVYRGVNRSVEPGELQPMQSGGWFGPANYVTRDAAEADRYAHRTGPTTFSRDYPEGANIMPLQVRGPFATAEQYNEAFKRNRPLISFGHTPSDRIAPRATEQLRAEGYTGVESPVTHEIAMFPGYDGSPANIRSRFDAATEAPRELPPLRQSLWSRIREGMQGDMALERETRTPPAPARPAPPPSDAEFAQMAMHARDALATGQLDAYLRSLSPRLGRDALEELRLRAQSGNFQGRGPGAEAASDLSYSLRTRLNALETPPITPPRPEPRLPGRASDGSVLPIRPTEPFRNSLRGGSDDLRDAAGMGQQEPPAFTNSMGRFTNTRPINDRSVAHDTSNTPRLQQFNAEFKGFGEPNWIMRMALDDAGGDYAKAAQDVRDHIEWLRSRPSNRYGGRNAEIERHERALTLLEGGPIRPTPPPGAPRGPGTPTPMRPGTPIGQGALEEQMWRAHNSPMQPGAMRGPGGGEGGARTWAPGERIVHGGTNRGGYSTTLEAVIGPKPEFLRNEDWTGLKHLWKGLAFGWDTEGTAYRPEMLQILDGKVSTVRQYIEMSGAYPPPDAAYQLRAVEYLRDMLRDRLANHTQAPAPEGTVGTSHMGVHQRRKVGPPPGAPRGPGAPVRPGTPIGQGALEEQMWRAHNPPPPPPQGITAYHGSPHDFDRFDMAHIGNGEGAQAYGHGLYFAENEGVARSYRDQISKDHFATADGLFNPMSLEHLNVRVRATRGDLQGAIDKANEVIGSPTTPEATRAMAERDLSRLQQIQRSGGIKPHAGRMYQVRINANPDDFLDWDKPLSEQSPNVLNGIRNNPLWADMHPRITKAPDWYSPSPEQTVDDIIGTLRDKHGFSNADARAEASRRLRAAGIPGIRYLDQGSRSAGEGSRNYVVFDHDLVNITRKYGLPLGLFGGQAALSRRKAASS